MKNACFILLFACSSACAQQYYLRGEVKDESGNALQNVTILHVRTGYVYKTGSYGTFGIVNTQQADTLVFSLSGYQKEKLLADADQFLYVKMKLLPVLPATAQRNKLTSFTKNLERVEQRKWFAGEETYASIAENQFIEAKKYPVTGMSLNIDRASYSNIRRFINFNSFVPNDAVRIEEMMNYFNFDYTAPAGKDLFKIKTILTTCPWNKENELFYINLSSRKINLDSLPPGNFVFLIDISGSMDMPNRLPLLKSAFRLLVNNLREKDTVSIVVYGAVVGIKLLPTSGAEKEKILKAIDELTPGGFTPGESGIRLAYEVAQRHFVKNGNNRVILATDGDFNVGLKTEDELNELISKHRESGIYLTCLGVGMGNYKDSKIQTLARKGNGNFAYLDNFQEAEKVLFREFAQTLYAVADDVYMNVEFNPEYVKQYRLIGFDNKVKALKDSASVAEGGEIGSGYSTMAVFEISPTEINRGAIKDQFYGNPFASVKVQYKLPHDNTNNEYRYDSEFEFVPFAEVEKSYRFAAAVIMFGSLLRSSPYTKNTSWDDIINLAAASSDQDNILQKEFIEIVQKAKLLYSKFKKKRIPVD